MSIIGETATTKVQAEPLVLQQLRLFQFKNYSEAEISFGSRFNIFVGRNGTGKTNLLDAIHYLCLTRSALSPTDSANVQHGNSVFMLQGQLLLNDQPEKVICSVSRGKKKVFKVDDQEYDRISEHIGRYPVVLLSPDDPALVREGSELRRRFFDSMICQTDPQYLQHLLRYNHALRQRNALLKQPHEPSAALLEPYNHQLSQHGEQIAAKRAAFMAPFAQQFQAYYQLLAQQAESVTLTYEPQIKEPLLAAFENALPKDLLLQRTTVGTHRDDFGFYLGEHLLRRTGSQGQLKTFVMALKFAQFSLMQQLLKRTPLLLLDDIFDKLDDDRIRQLLSLLSHSRFGQVFITDARPERSAQLVQQQEMAELTTPPVFFKVEQLIQ